MNIIDILIVVALAAAVFKGFRKGIAGSLGKLLGYLLGLATGFLFSESLAEVVDRSFGLSKKLMLFLGKNSSLPAWVNNTKVEDVPVKKVQDLVSTLPVPDTFQYAFSNYLGDIAHLSDKGITNLGDGLMYLLSNLLLSGLCFMVLYFIVSYFFGVIIPKWFKKALPGPLTLVDHFGGACLGLISGFISIAIAIGILIPLTALGALQGLGDVGILGNLADWFNESTLAAGFFDIVIRLVSEFRGA